MRAMRHPKSEDIELTRVLYALSDPLRLDVVRRLDREGEATCAALDCGRPKSSMSHHFRVLRDSGVVRTRTDGTAHMNELRRAELDSLFPGLLDSILASGGGAAGRPDAED
jgi:DNA-binding transcriptional ArsR family regulator